MQKQYTGYYRQIGAKIKYYRERKGISQLKLAELAGISRTHMSNLEAPHMDKAVSLETLMNIADVIEVPLRDFFDFEQ